MSVCPHCVLVAVAAAGATIPFLPAAWRNLKGSLLRQKMKKAGFDQIYGDPDGR